jgi:hypothetical protein
MFSLMHRSLLPVGHSIREPQIQHETAHSRQRRARGAAILEGLIVTALVTLFLASAIFLHGAYQAKLFAIRAARVGAWSSALQGCGSGVDVSAVGGSIADLGNGGDIPIVSAWLGLTDASKQSSEQYQEPGPAGKNSTMTARCIVSCDEKHSDDSSFGNLPNQFVSMATKDP